MFPRLFAEHPLCYALVFIVLDALFGGIAGLVAMCFARWCGSRFSTIMAPFALYVFTGVIFEGTGIGTWSAMAMINPIRKCSYIQISDSDNVCCGMHSSTCIDIYMA